MGSFAPWLPHAVKLEAVLPRPLYRGLTSLILPVPRAHLATLNHTQGAEAQGPGSLMWQRLRIICCCLQHSWVRNTGLGLQELPREASEAAHTHFWGEARKSGPKDSCGSGTQRQTTPVLSTAQGSWKRNRSPGPAVCSPLPRPSENTASSWCTHITPLGKNMYAMPCTGGREPHRSAS